MDEFKWTQIAEKCMQDYTFQMQENLADTLAPKFKH